MTACPDCTGSGYYLTAIRISGEMVDADYAERTCETCDGLSEVDHECPDDRMCPDCGSMPLYLLHKRCREALVEDFDRWLGSLKQDHSAYVEKIGQALLRVERRVAADSLTSAPPALEWRKHERL